MRGLALRRPAVSVRGPLVIAGVLLTALGAASAVVTPRPDGAVHHEPALSERLGPQTWALAIPVPWLAAPLPGARAGDVVDILGTRAGERATASEVATGLRVMSVGEGAIVVELTADAAASIAAARARGLALIPILRSVE